jgi:hypothetical protein
MEKQPSSIWIHWKCGHCGVYNVTNKHIHRLEKCNCGNSGVDPMGEDRMTCHGKVEFYRPDPVFHLGVKYKLSFEPGIWEVVSSNSFQDICMVRNPDGKIKESSIEHLDRMRQMKSLIIIDGN